MRENTLPAGEIPADNSGASSLRPLLMGAGLAAAAILAAGRPAQAQATTKPSLTFAQIPGTGDIKVLNYALALEALEADLYVQALARLQALGIASSEPDYRYAEQFGTVEANHRDFLNNALGAQSIIGTGANGILRNATFDFGMANRSRREVVDLLYTVEDTGVKAYLGAITSFDTKQFLAAAGAIQATEARHTAVIAAVSNTLFSTNLNTAPLANENNGIDSTLTPDQVLAIVSGPNGFIVLPASS